MEYFMKKSFLNAWNLIVPKHEKTEYVSSKRSSGRKFRFTSSTLNHVDSLAQLPVEEFLSPLEVTDTFDLFADGEKCLERVKFKELKSSHFSCKNFSAFLCRTPQGNASIVIARRQIRQLQVVILMHQMNFTGGKTVAMIALADMLRSAGFKVKITALWLTSSPPKNRNLWH
jgi:hypothetical protein